jgi:hypothetical protein
MARLRFSSYDRAEALDLLLLRLAVQVVPDADSASVTVHNPDKYRTLRAHDGQALLLDEAQYRTKLGPCIEALQEDNQICTETYFACPSFRRRPEAIGVRSVLSTPVCVSDSVRARLHMYSFSTFSSVDPLGRGTAHLLFGFKPKLR